MVLVDMAKGEMAEMVEVGRARVLVLASSAGWVGALTEASLPPLCFIIPDYFTPLTNTNLRHSTISNRVPV
jgi:hypothetical protein